MYKKDTNNLIIVDGHQDVADWLELSGGDFYAHNTASVQVDYNKLTEGNIKLSFWAVFVDEEYKKKDSLFQTLYFLNKYKTLLADKHNKKLLLVKDKTSLNEVLNTNKNGVLLHLEGADGINDPNFLSIFKELGVCSIGLTWNPQNQHAGGVNSDGGLSTLGKELILKMGELGILLDVSHLNEKSFWQALKLAKGPIVATHANAYSICKHKRNLKDKQIKAIAESGGLVGITFVPKFLRDLGIAAIDDVVTHIKYVADLVGVDHVGLGSDFGTLAKVPKGLTDIVSVGKLVDLLEKEGFSKSDITKVMGGNWLVVIKKLFGANENEWWEGRYTQEKALWAYNLVHKEVLSDNVAKEEVKKLVEVVQPDKEAKILDVCAGEGRHLLELLKNGYENIVGLDFSPQMLVCAKNSLESNQFSVPLIKADVRKLPFMDNSFDMVTCLGNSGLGFFEDEDDDIVMAKAIYKVLVAGGKFVFDHTDTNYFLSHFAGGKDKPKEVVGEAGKKYVVTVELAMQGDRIVKTEIIKDAVGDVVCVNKVNRKLFHKEVLIDLLKEVGFSKVDVVGTYDYSQGGIKTHWMAKRDLYVAQK